MPLWKEDTIKKINKKIRIVGLQPGLHSFHKAHDCPSNPIGRRAQAEAYMLTPLDATQQMRSTSQYQAIADNNGCKDLKTQVRI